jgi:hypothetical protein
MNRNLTHKTRQGQDIPTAKARPELATTAATKSFNISAI